MQLPHLANFNIRARSLFQKIYRNQKIDVSKSKDTLKEQLNLYIAHLSTHLTKKISAKDEKRILDIITRNNHVAQILHSREFRKIVQKKQELLGSTALGLIFCIDGRIPAIFLGGRFASHWEVPAGEITVIKRKSDLNLVPESSELCEAFRKLVNSEKEILEIVFGHTSLLNPGHGCGAMAAKKKAGLLPKNLSLEEANLKIIEEKTIPAITTIYNEFRVQKGFDPLKIVGVSAIYDTDTFGVILNLDKKNQKLSTTELASKYKTQIEDYFKSSNLTFGSFKDKFSYLKYLVRFSQNILKITHALLENPHFGELSSQLDVYLTQNYPGLTNSQHKALKFFLSRNIAFQYLTGACNLSKKNLKHPFVHHEEEYMAVSTRGTTIGKFDPQNQGFSSTPADPVTAISHIKTKLSIMGAQPIHKPQPYLLFICNPVNLRDLTENSIQLHKIMDANAELFRSIITDKQLGEMVDQANLIPISILIEEDTREVLKIIDHSAYV